MFLKSLLPDSADRTITVVTTDIDKLGANNKSSQKLDNDGEVVDKSQTQSIVVNILDNPLAIVNKDGNKTLTLTGNPEGAQKIMVI